MTDIPTLHKDTDSFHDKFDETCDYRQFEDDDDVPCDEENVDLVDEDKMELTGTLEKESEFYDGGLHTSFQNSFVPYGVPGAYNYPTPSPCFPDGSFIPTSNPVYRYFPHTFWQNRARLDMPIDPNKKQQTSGIPKPMMAYAEHEMPSLHNQLPGFNPGPNFSKIPGGFYNQDPSLYSMDAMDPYGKGFFLKPGNMMKMMGQEDRMDMNGGGGGGDMSMDKQKTSIAHIKKPLNAFMLYMKDVRPEVLKQVPHKDSTTINQMIGKMWQALSKVEQSYYFELARKERERHKEMYPEYNPRDFYAQSIKKKRRKRDKQGNGEPLPKKCRARFGINQQEKWCKHCKRKKKCLRFLLGADPDCPDEGFNSDPKDVANQKDTAESNSPQNVNTGTFF